MAYTDRRKEDRLIKLLAPVTLERADDPDVSAIVEMDRDNMRAIAACMQVVLDNPDISESSGGIVSERSANELWSFFVKGENQP
jgi:hypothetical protein